MTGRQAGTAAGGEAGFSLAEVLVALVLISVLAGTMAVMTGQFRRLIDISGRNGEQLALQAAARHMARLIEQAELMPLDAGDGGKAVYLAGEKTQVRFVAMTRLGAQMQGLRSVSFEVTPDQDLVQTSLSRRKGTDRVLPSAALMTANVLAAEFAYFGSLDPDNGKPVWHESWAEPGRLPLAVSVHVTRMAKGGQTLTASDVAWIARP
ncbi:MAG: prepilin-type N-terminal cleavage/methylation domain-containing protein [Rhizobiaceae bacterium]